MPSIYDLIEKVDKIMRQIIGILFTAGTVVFLWGVIQYMSAAGDEKKIKDARQKIYYGIIGLALMVAVWGIVRVIVTTFELDTNGNSPLHLPNITQIETNNPNE